METALREVEMLTIAIPVQKIMSVMSETKCRRAPLTEHPSHVEANLPGTTEHHASSVTHGVHFGVVSLELAEDVTCPRDNDFNGNQREDAWNKAESLKRVRDSKNTETNGGLDH
jgi:hypothetical protein